MHGASDTLRPRCSPPALEESLTTGPSAGPAGSARIVVRDVLGAAWPLFQVCLPTCLPLAVVAVAVSSIPIGQLPGHEWWGIVFARTMLVLICYGAMLRQQVQLSAAGRPRLRQSLTDAVRDLPAVVVIVAAWLLPFAPAMATTASRGFDWLSLLLTIAASVLVAPLLPAWPALLAGTPGPWLALVASVRLVRGQWLQVCAVVLTLLAGILIFLLLASIMIGMVMNLAGQGIHPTAGALAISRVLIALVLAVPVIYAGATAIVTWRATSIGSAQVQP
jgi:hypothetical protein